MFSMQSLTKYIYTLIRKIYFLYLFTSVMQIRIHSIIHTTLVMYMTLRICNKIIDKSLYLENRKLVEDGKSLRV